MRVSTRLRKPWNQAAVLFLALAFASAGTAWAQAGAGGLIYSCTDAAGKKITRDRYIAECNMRDQRVLNADGSLRQVLPPTMTTEERGVVEEREREAAAALKRQQEEGKRDRNLITRFPNEAAHRKARELALEDSRQALRVSEQRLVALAKERKPLTDESEFYVGKPLPLKLKLALDANDASVDAQKSLVQNQQREIVRVNQLYDAELERLRALWNGARPGSLGPVAAASAAPRK